MIKKILLVVFSLIIVSYIYIKEKSYDYTIIVNYAIPSSKDRFFVYERDTLLFSCKVAHGSGKGSTSENPVFSNIPNSLCSSLGTYITYKNVPKCIYNKPAIGLIGLSCTNFNAPIRGLLIHGGLRNYKGLIPVNSKISAGCLTIPTNRLKQLMNLKGTIKVITKYEKTPDDSYL